MAAAAVVVVADVAAATAAAAAVVVVAATAVEAAADAATEQPTAIERPLRRSFSRAPQKTRNSRPSSGSPIVTTEEGVPSTM